MEKRFLFITCEEAKHICDKSQYDEATWWEKVKLNIRLSWCKVTRAYTKRNRQLTKAVNSSNADCLSEKERQSMSAKFNEELAKH